MEIQSLDTTQISNLYNNSRINNLYGIFFNKKTMKPLEDYFLKNKNSLQIALDELEKLKFYPEDIKKIQSYGAKIAFNNGKEAVDFAKKENIAIVFDKVDRPDIHAQWVHGMQKIIINDKYKDTKDKAEILAISAAILHELSHAKDKDDISSIQEEIDCLSMNAIAFNVFRKNFLNLFNNNKAEIINDGVMVYTDLFLGNNKKALMNRIKDKYGNLQLSSPNHSAGTLAMQIANN